MCTCFCKRKTAIAIYKVIEDSILYVNNRKELSYKLSCKFLLNLLRRFCWLSCNDTLPPFCPTFFSFAYRKAAGGVSHLSVCCCAAFETVKEFRLWFVFFDIYSNFLTARPLLATTETTCFLLLALLTRFFWLWLL